MSDYGATESQPGIVQQFIHSKLVGSPRDLTTLLKDTYGPGNFKVEMRHNIYCISVISSLETLNLEKPSVRNFLSGNII
jgi:hypothetical protein